MPVPQRRGEHGLRRSNERSDTIELTGIPDARDEKLETLGKCAASRRFLLVRSCGVVACDGDGAAGWRHVLSLLHVSCAACSRIVRRPGSGSSLVGTAGLPRTTAMNSVDFAGRHNELRRNGVMRQVESPQYCWSGAP